MPGKKDPHRLRVGNPRTRSACKVNWAVQDAKTKCVWGGLSWSVLLVAGLIFNGGLYRWGRECSPRGCYWVRIPVFCSIQTGIHLWACACGPVIAWSVSRSARFVYPGWADVKTPSAVGRQTKSTHLAEIKQKLSWPLPPSLRLPSTHCLSRCGIMCLETLHSFNFPDSVMHFTPPSPGYPVRLFEYTTSPQTWCV